MLLTMSNEGQVTWSPSLVLRTACEVDVTVYPYDTQTCAWSLYPWVLTDDSVVLKPDPTTNGFSKKDFSKSVEWDLLHSETSLCDLEEEDKIYSCIKFDYIMRRRSMFLSLTVIVPTLLLAMLSALVFALPAESGEKVSLAMTLMLTFVFLLSFVINVLPQSSLHISLFVTFLVFLCTCSALSLVLAIIVLSFYHRPDCVPLTPSAVRFVRCVRGWRECCRVGGKRSRLQPRVCPMKLKSTKEPALREGVDVPRNGVFRPEDSLPDMKGRHEKKDRVRSADEHGDGAGSASPEMTWRDVAEACDYLFLRVFVIGIVIVCSAGCAYLLSDS
ncbi:neuronal acetylcholine receptor subunit beta-2-like [Littorina saxatilis]